MTDVYTNLSKILSHLSLTSPLNEMCNAPDKTAEIISGATGIDKNTLMIATGAVLAVGTAAVLLFKCTKPLREGPAASYGDFLSINGKTKNGKTEEDEDEYDFEPDGPYNGGTWVKKTKK